MSVHALFFDLDETLVWLDLAAARPVEVASWELVAGETGLDAATLQAAHRAVVPDVWKAAELHALENRERLDGPWLMLETYRQALLACGCDDITMARRVLDAYWSNRKGIIKVFEEVDGVLEGLRGRYHLAVITNGPAITQLDKLEVTSLDSYFDLIVASGDIGYAKPDATIFEFVLAKLGVTTSQAWHVGDNLDSDVRGAHNAGLTSVWLNRHGVVKGDADPVPHYEITSLRELPALLAD